MPIIVRHTPASLVGQLAIQAGQARARQTQASRDVSLLQSAMANQERGADIAAQRAYGLQRAGAAQVARRRSVEPEVAEQRRELRKTIRKAEKAGIYSPTQIKRMQIFADLGDAGAVRGILGTLPKPVKAAARPARERELGRQMKVLDQLVQEQISPVQRKLQNIDRQLSERYTPETLKFLQENVEYMPDDVKPMLTQRQQLQTQINEMLQEAEEPKRLIAMGIGLPEQMRTKQLTEADKIYLNIERSQEQSKQRDISRSIKDLKPDLKIDKYADSTTETNRVAGVRKQIKSLETDLEASCQREKAFVRQLFGDVTAKPQPSTVEQPTNAGEGNMDAIMEEAGGDINKAMQILRERGITK